MAAAYQDRGNLTKQSFVHKRGDRQNSENTSLANPTGRGDLPCSASWLRPNEIWHCCPPFCNVLCTVDQQKQKSTRSGGVCSLFVFELQCNQGKKPLSLSLSLRLTLFLPCPWDSLLPEWRYWKKRQLQPYCTAITRSQRNQLAFGDKPDCCRSSFLPLTALQNEWLTKSIQLDENQAEMANKMQKS